MSLILAGILSGALFIFCLLRGKKGFREMNAIIIDFCSSGNGKLLFVGGTISAILLAFLLLTGLMSLGEIVSMEQKVIELCPFCM